MNSPSASAPVDHQPPSVPVPRTTPPRRRRKRAWCRTGSRVAQLGIVAPSFRPAFVYGPTAGRPAGLHRFHNARPQTRRLLASAGPSSATRRRHSRSFRQFRQPAVLPPVASGAISEGGTARTQAFSASLDCRLAHGPSGVLPIGRVPRAVAAHPTQTVQLSPTSPPPVGAASAKSNPDPAPTPAPAAAVSPAVLPADTVEAGLWAARQRWAQFLCAQRVIAEE